MKWISICVLMGLVSSSNAATIAVIDSGLDYKHEMIAPNLWTNANEVQDRRDNDGNGYQDDVHGWNFGEQNGQLIDYSYLGKFSPNCKKYFDIQGKVFLKQATEEEIAWIKAIVKDKDFIKEMGVFGNFIHGTHVSGITIEHSRNEVMGIKLIPTEVKPFLEGFARQKGNLNIDRWALLEKGVDLLAAQQMNLLADIARFVAYHKGDIANGSFGTGFTQLKMIGDLAYKVLFFKKPSEEDSNRAARLVLKGMLKHGQTFVGAAPDTLFVFAAGNDGLSNDDFGTSPANIKADNVITVGATYKNEFFASFSNYGTKMVDIAAPGMLINSAIPGNEYLQVSGTSQASPYVANVAAQIKEANPNLKPVQIKTILMGTVDKKAFLNDKVTAGGIVNSERAVVAAEISKSLPINLAVMRANLQVKDAKSWSVDDVDAKAIVPMALAPMFR